MKMAAIFLTFLLGAVCGQKLRTLCAQARNAEKCEPFRGFGVGCAQKCQLFGNCGKRVPQSANPFKIMAQDVPKSANLV